MLCNIIQANLIDLCHKFNVKNSFLSVLPVFTLVLVMYQLRIELLSGELNLNQWYAITKIQGVKMCEAYNRQYNSNFSCVMPTNLFGINDKYDEKTSYFN